MLRSDGANQANQNVQLSHRNADSALDYLLPIIIPSREGSLQLTLARTLNPR